MPVRRRSNGSWLIDFVAIDGRRVRKTIAGTIPRRDAETLERRLRADDAAGRRAAPARSVRDLLARYWTEHGRHVASRKDERGYLDAWADALGDHAALDDVTVDRLAEIVALWRIAPNRRRDARPETRARPVAPATINKRLSCLRRIWRRAVDLWGWDLARIPWGRLMLAEPDPRDRSLSPAQRRAFIAAIAPRSRGLVRMAFATGLRRGALLRLTVADLDLERGVIRAISKGRAGGREVIVPITREVRAILRLIGVPQVGRLFPVTDAQLRRDLRAAAAVTGLPAGIHQARHTFAQDLEDAGLGDAITAALHHSTPRMRERYAKARVDRTRQAIEAARKARGR